MSSNWASIFKTGNETDHETLNTFRQFHCADCLNSFQEKKQNFKESTCTSSNSRMNTPPPPLLPITEDTMQGLYHYFGQPNIQPQITNNLRLLSNTNNNASAVNGSNMSTDQLNLDSDSSLGSIFPSSNPAQRVFEQTSIMRNYETKSGDDNLQHTSIQEKKHCKIYFKHNFLVG